MLTLRRRSPNRSVNLYGGPRPSSNRTALNILANAAASNIVNTRPNVKFSRTRRIVTNGAKHFAIYAAVTGLETLIPSSIPGLTVQLCLAAPSIYKAVRQRRPNLATASSVISVFWLVMFRGAAGVRETMIITKKSSLFDPVTRTIGKIIDKHIKGSANSKSVKYAILYYLAQFVRAFYQTMGYPLYDSANSYGKKFAADFSGHLGTSLVGLLKTSGKTGFKIAKKYPVSTAASVVYGAATYMSPATRRESPSPARKNVSRAGQLRLGPAN